MAIGQGPGGSAARQLRAAFEVGRLGDLPDGPLLDRFLAGGPGAEAAFAALVDRHAAAAWHACRAVLADRHRAEDAFQATFLVLARRADSLRNRDSIGPWLRQVARRTASGLRAADLRRRRHERRAADVASRITPDPPRDPETAAALRAEVDRLPAALRAAVVLCDLEGRTHAEAARALGWPLGTVKSRQARARRLIHDRLARRGFGPAALGLGLDPIPRGLVAAATRSATGSGASADILFLAQRTIQAMLWNHLRSVAATAALAITVAAGTTGLAVVGAQDPVPTPSTATSAPGRGPTPVEAPAPTPVAPAARPAPSRRGVVRIAFLLPEGNIPGPSFEPDLSRALRIDPARVTMQITRLRSVTPEIVHSPIVYLPVWGDVGLTPGDVAALRDHLTTGGGTMLADAADSDPARDAAFRRFVAELLPEGRLEPIPQADPLFYPNRGFDLARSRTTPALGGRVGPAELEGVRVDGRWAVIYSKLDLGAFDPDPAEPDRRGYARESGIEIAANTVLYATAPGIPDRADRPAAPPGDRPAEPARALEEAAARPQLRAQQLATRKARIAADMARLARELADLGVQEYEEVTYPRDLAAAEGEIRRADGDLTRARDRAEWSEKMHAQGYVSEATKVADKLTLERARFDLEQVRTQRDIVVKYTHDKTLRALQAGAAKAEADQSASEAVWGMEQARQARLESEVAPK